MQPGSREWVTVIEAIIAASEALDLKVICKGKNYQGRWYRAPELGGGLKIHNARGWSSFLN
jgi:hypothetical protein